MELEERYIRTYDGFIIKIKVVSKENAPLVLCVINNKPYTVNDIKKASNNIIDLIEVGDYVNGAKVDEIVYIGHGLPQDLEICFRYKYAFEKDDVYTLKEKDIKSILTKEQFESMSYKVGE